jgi:hypothetical protein
LKRFALAFAISFVALVPSTALADSGSITNVHAIGGGMVEATYTATSTYCTVSGYCGFFADATQVAPTEACDAYNTTGRLTWVSDDVLSTSGTLTGTDTFFPKTTGPVKICLHLSQGSSRQVTVAEFLYTPPSQTAATTTASSVATATPTPAAPAVVTPTARPAITAASLSYTTANANVKRSLKKQFGTRFSKARNVSRACNRSSATKIRCAVSWTYKKARYSGTVSVISTAEAGVVSKVVVKKR